MQDFLFQNFFGILCCIAAFGISYILRDINNNISELQKEYKQLIAARAETKISLMNDISEIKELISERYVKKIDLAPLIASEVQKIIKGK